MGQYGFLRSDSRRVIQSPLEVQVRIVLGELQAIENQELEPAQAGHRFGRNLATVCQISEITDSETGRGS